MNPTPKQIKQARQQAGLSQQKAADLIGVTLRTWAYWESGEFKMKEGLWRLFQILTERN